MPPSDDPLHDFPDRAFMREIAEHNTGNVLRQLAGTGPSPAGP